MGSDFSTLARHTPVRALRPSSRRNISKLLDKHIPSELNRYNDIRGFMELALFPNEVIESVYESETPTKNFINSWERLAKERRMDKPTIFIAWEILKKLGRSDIISQGQTVVEDARAYAEDKKRQEAPQRPYDIDEEHTFITTEDVRSGRYTLYDAFVMYVEEDEKYVLTLYNKARERGLKLLLPQYHILPGLPTHSTWAYAISKRCRKLILVISHRFVKSENCEFVVHLSTNLSSAARTRKVIPILLEEDIRIHETLGFLNMFHPEDGLDTLMTAIQAPTRLESFNRCQSYPQCSPNVATVSPTPRSKSYTSESREPISNSNLEEDERLCSMIHRLDIQERFAQEQPLSAHFPIERSAHSLPETLYRRTNIPDVQPYRHEVLQNETGHVSLNTRQTDLGLDAFTNQPVMFSITDNQNERVSPSSNPDSNSFQTISHGGISSPTNTDNSSYMFVQTRGNSRFDTLSSRSNGPFQQLSTTQGYIDLNIRANATQDELSNDINESTTPEEIEQRRHIVDVLNQMNDRSTFQPRQPTILPDVRRVSMSSTDTANDNGDGSYVFIQSRGQIADNSPTDRTNTEAGPIQSTSLQYRHAHECDPLHAASADNIDSQQEIDYEALFREDENECEKGIVDSSDAQLHVHENPDNEPTGQQDEREHNILVDDDASHNHERPNDLDEPYGVYV